MGGRLRRLPVMVASALAIAGLGAHAGAAARQPLPPVAFEVPSLFPRFSPSIHDYTVRCDDGPVTVKLHASGAWRIAIGDHALQRGDFRQAVPLSAGQTFIVAAKQHGYRRLHRYRVRCLPSDFPTYTFVHHGTAVPKYFSVDASFFTPWGECYSIIFDSHGVPIWWRHTAARDTRVLRNGNILWFDRPSNRWEIHRLDGSLVRTLHAVGQVADPHDLQWKRNGDYLVAADVMQSGVDTSSYGGSSDADVLNTELQQVSPGGRLVWNWDSQDHISLAETGRWWPHIIETATDAYDILHWNSIEPDGGSVIASFRNLDAVYKIKKSTGEIAWKLGGTTTPESLQVKDDPRRYTLGGQHDARLLADGTLTVFDDRTELANHTPRAVRYRINGKERTATLLESISDPAVPASTCCGSARRLANGSWLIDWGRNPLKHGLSNGIGGYKPNGARTFLLSFDSTASYRAEPVPNGALTVRDLRRGMRAMCRSGCD